MLRQSGFRQLSKMKLDPRSRYPFDPHQVGVSAPAFCVTGQSLDLISARRLADYHRRRIADLQVVWFLWAVDRRSEAYAAHTKRAPNPVREIHCPPIDPPSSTPALFPPSNSAGVCHYDELLCAASTNTSQPTYGAQRTAKPQCGNCWYGQCRTPWILQSPNL